MRKHETVPVAGKRLVRLADVYDWMIGLDNNVEFVLVYGWCVHGN